MTAQRMPRQAEGPPDSSDAPDQRGGRRSWRRKASQIGAGHRQTGRWGRRIVVGFDDNQFDELRSIATERGLPLGSVIRTLAEMGLADIEDGSRVFVSGEEVSPPKPIVVPGWVPLDLRRDYTDLADLEGEEAAAAYVRARKREAA